MVVVCYGRLRKNVYALLRLKLVLSAFFVLRCNRRALLLHFLAFLGVEAVAVVAVVVCGRLVPCGQGATRVRR